MFQVNQDALENLFSLLRACFGGNNTKPSPMKVIQGLKIILLTKMNNLGAIICEGAAVRFQDSGEHDMNENFLPSQTVSYKEVQDAVSEVQEEEEMVQVLETVEDQIPIDENNSLLNKNIEEYIGGWIEKKVIYMMSLKM